MLAQGSECLKNYKRPHQLGHLSVEIHYLSTKNAIICANVVISFRCIKPHKRIEPKTRDMERCLEILIVFKRIFLCLRENIDITVDIVVF